MPAIGYSSPLNCRFVGFVELCRARAPFSSSLPSPSVDSSLCGSDVSKVSGCQLAVTQDFGFHVRTFVLSLLRKKNTNSYVSQLKLHVSKIWRMYVGSIRT
jgi:hypothetical protein